MKVKQLKSLLDQVCEEDDVYMATPLTKGFNICSISKVKKGSMGVYLVKEE